jgi:hypothetical protein
MRTLVAIPCFLSIRNGSGNTTTTADACAAAPEIGCWAPDAPGAAVFQVSNPTGSSGDSLLWKSNTGFGFAPSSGAYSVCLYNGSGALLFGGTAPGDAMCDGSPCWRPMGVSSLKYKDRTRTPDSIDSILLKGRSDGRLKIVLRGKGANLSSLAPLPMPPLTLPLHVQLQGPGGSCWEATYSGARRNEAGRFLARSD